MRLKSDVRLDNLRPQMVLAALVVWRICEAFGVNCTITSGSDGTHSATSLHYSGAALDFRTRDLEEGDREAFAAQVRDFLTADYDVVLEATHLHVEHQPKCREVALI